jgi:hypothetical protein
MRTRDRRNREQPRLRTGRLTGSEAAAGPADRSAHRLYAEVVWATVDRLALVGPEARGPIEAQIIALCRRLDVEPVAVRVTSSRVRLLLRFKPSHSLGAVVAAIKLGSQDAAVLSGRPVRWARGFAALSLSGREVRRRALRLRSAD